VPDVEGDGVLRQLEVPGRRGVVSSAATFDGAFVAFDTTGPAPVVCIANRHFEFVRKSAEPGDKIDAAFDSPLLLCRSATGWKFQIVSVPDLVIQETYRVATAEDRAAIGSIGSLCVCARKGGWLHVNAGGEVAEILTSPLRLGRSGHLAASCVQAAAIDGSGRWLVACDEDGYAELYDVQKMETTHRLKLDAVADFRSVCVQEGVAWIGCTNGTILQVDLASCAIVKRLVMDSGGMLVNVRFSLGRSRKYLAVCVSAFRDATAHPTTLKVFDTEGASLTEVASARATLPHAVGGVTLCDREKAVVLESQYPVFVWDYATTRGGAGKTK